MKIRQGFLELQLKMLGMFFLRHTVVVRHICFITDIVCDEK